MVIKTIGVLGAGTMGNGIAQIAAQAGYDVVLCDIEDKFVQNGLKNIDKFLSKSVEKGKITADVKATIMGKIKGTTNIADMKDADFVVEAVLEEMDLKKKVFKQLDEITKKEAIITSNTSSMSITEIAKATSRPDKVAGMHFFNPVPLMRLVEVIRSYYASDETIATCMDLSRKLGKEPIEVKKDVPGFVVNRLMVPHLVEGICLLQEGVASKEDIDKAAKLGLNYPMGPLELIDLTGVDILLNVVNYFFQEHNKELKWVAPRLLKDMVKAGRLGMKSGAGWYDYPKK
ncbi:MAG: 3-hydroxyacyl-CoA dehydrogenase NAD-binding domain-containing protein [Proteobacteria bacterium]|nr:3-hydroxyacyl-CoA dehydrogenase NAD-binding domain-containing protein [Pseudomonadota bacterium]